MPRETSGVAVRRWLDPLSTRLRELRLKYSRRLSGAGLSEAAAEAQPLAGLPEGAVFVSGGKLYRVVEAGGGASFARPWEGPRQEQVVLDPDSLAARFHPVIAYGEPLPEFEAKADLLDAEGRVLSFVFRQARDAERAGRIDEALSRRTGLRLQGVRTGLLGLTDGLHAYRLYVHAEPSSRLFEGINLPYRRQAIVLDAAEGPSYWDYLENHE